MTDKRGAIPKIVSTKRVTPQFQRSTKTSRTPPPIKANESIYLCQICLVEDGIEKIQCDKCILWYHFVCAKLNKSVLKQDVWVCFNCVEKQQPLPAQRTDPIDIGNENPSGYSIEPPQKASVFEKPPSVGHKSKGSRKASSNASTISRRATLALQRLEEERRLIEMREIEAAERQRERDKEYLNQKYSILEDDVTSNLSFDDQELEHQKIESIRQWAENIPHPNENALDKDGAPIDTEIHRRGPQLSSTSVNHQSSVERTETNEMPGNVITTVQSNLDGNGPQIVVSNSRVVLPDWLTNPTMSETGICHPRLVRAMPEREVLPSEELRNYLPWMNRYSSLDERINEELRIGRAERNALSLQTNNLPFATDQLINVVDRESVEPLQLPAGQMSKMINGCGYVTTSSTSGTQATKTSAQQQLIVVSDQANIDGNAHQQGNPMRQATSNQIAGVQNVCSTLSQQPFVDAAFQLNMQPATVHSSDQFVSQQPTNLNPTDNVQVSQRCSTLSQQPFVDTAFQLNMQPATVHSSDQFVSQQPTNLNPTDNVQVASHMSPTTKFSPFMSASKPQWSFSQPQWSFSQPQIVNASQRLTADRSNDHGQQYNSNRTFNIGHSQANLNHQTNQNQMFDVGTANGSYSQSFNVGQPYSQAQPLTFVHSVGNHSQNTTIPTINQSNVRSQSMGVKQQQFVFSQPQYLSSGQQQHLNAHQQFGTSQPFGTGQQYTVNQPVSNSNQLGGNSQTYSQPLAFGQSFTNGQRYVPVSSAASQSLMGSHSHIPNNINASTMTQRAGPGRLTAEQIASRHVMPRDLPQFSGDPREWYAFISAYENSNEACGFSNSENLGRLQKCLKGDAEAAVKTRLLHKDSVPGVIETLRLMFGRPELIMEAMLGDVHEMPPPKENDLPALIKFAMAVQNLSATIQHVGATEHLRNPMIMNSIVDKLPTMHRLNWAFHKQMIGNVHIGHLGDWLYNMADVASQVVRVSSKPVKKNEPHKDKNKSKSDATKQNPFLNTQVEKTSSSDQSRSESKKNCPACNGNKCNKLVNCKAFKDATRAERWTIVKKGKLCGRCFGNHKYFRCQSDQTCSIDGCKAHHHALLHNYEPLPQAASQNGKNSSETKTKESSGTEKKTCNSQRSKFSKRIDKFRIVPVMLHNKGKSIRDYAYLDDGSNMTTIEESLADELGLAGSSKELCVDWAFGHTHSTMESKIVSLKISGYYDNAPRFKMTNVRTIKQLHLPTQSITSNWIDQYSHFKNIPIATYDDVKPRLLIGLQFSNLIVSQETIEGNDNEPIVCRTRLGWVVQGPTYESDNSATKRQFSMNVCVCQSNDNELHHLVKSYFALENIGTNIPGTILESKEIQRAKEILQSTTVKKGDRFETGLLWKHDDVELPANYNMALKRFICLEAKMTKNPELKSNLCNQIQKFTEKGYIRKLSRDEIENCRQRVWYLPTFPVFNPKKPTKVRLVWDGAAKVGQSSLNSNLLKGPDQLVPLPVLLRRFREREIGVTGDIEEMFHQIQVREQDQHAQRFLWREDVNKEPDVYIMTVMTFGSKCSPSSAQYVKNKNAEEFRHEFPRAVEAIVENHYVDDMIDCAESIDEAEKLVNEVKLIHRAGGFNIRNFASNSKELLARIGEKSTSQSKNLNIGDECGTERVLGMFWNVTNDTFTYSLKFVGISEKMLSGEHCPTKREILKILMSVFDPLGLISNFLVHGKIILQEIWRSKIEWDDKIPAPIHEKWLKWIKELPNVENLQIPRWYSPKLAASKSIQLHTFVDASVEAFAAMSFLRIKDNDGIQCCLVGAKTKVAPTKPMSVPRLELQAAVLGTRLANDIKASQKFVIQQQIFWSDSQTVLAWINSETRRYTQFVAFRVGEILESTEQKQWRWVSTKNNVADEATKSKTIPKLDSNSRWFTAPKFLYEEEQTWFDEKNEFETEEELKPCFVMSMREVHSEQLIDLNRFSQWNRLVRTQAYVLRFVHNVKTKTPDRRFGLLSQDELIQAENRLYQRAQRDVFLDEILILMYNTKVPLEKRKSFERSSELRTLSPYLDEHNVLRHKGRNDAAEVLSQETKRPIILPRRHRVTTLLVDWFHRKYKHINHQTALNEIRQKYIIPALRRVMRGVRNSCQKCKNLSAKPSIPEMAALPLARLAAFIRPFTYTGVDYFGPYYVRQNRSTVKRYGVIFTCLTVRAVHLEVADTLNTSSCIKAIRRFAARKGEPREFFSDNGSNFHGTEKELKEEFEKLDRQRIQQEFTSTEQKWTFNPPTASHMGGVWERLIQTVKRCLNQILTTKTPTQEMLVTLMAEVENIINSRPLTYVSLDSTDEEALTPNHFIFGSSNALKPIGDTTPRDLTRNDWRAIQEMTNHFWNRFVLEYMPDLTRRTKWFKEVKPIKVGDVVLVIDNRNPRNTWPKGLVEEVFPDRNGRIRHVMVKFGKRTLPRPVSKLAVLDVRDHNNDEMVKLPHMESVNEGENVVNRPVDENTNRDNSAIVLPDRYDIGHAGRESE